MPVKVGVLTWYNQGPRFSPQYQRVGLSKHIIVLIFKVAEKVCLPHGGHKELTQEATARKLIIPARAYH